VSLIQYTFLQDLSNNSLSGSLEGVATDAEGTQGGSSNGAAGGTGRKLLQGQGGVSDPLAAAAGTGAWQLPRLQFLDLSRNKFEGKRGRAGRGGGQWVRGS
jgi:hypothetical protein